MSDDPFVTFYDRKGSREESGRRDTQGASETDPLRVPTCVGEESLEVLVAEHRSS